MTRPLWDAIEDDHDRIWDLLNQLTGGGGVPDLDPDQKLRVSRQLTAVASSHEIAEEIVVWPVVRDLCPEGRSLVLQANAQERQANESSTSWNTSRRATRSSRSVFDRWRLMPGSTSASSVRRSGLGSHCDSTRRPRSPQSSGGTPPGGRRRRGPIRTRRQFLLSLPRWEPSLPPWTGLGAL
jgi:hypothetical protein